MQTQAVERVVVYRGVEASSVELVETMLEAEGLEPRRLGRANPALAGLGMHAVEQRIDVPTEHASAARDLIQASEHALDDGALRELEEQAVAQPVPSSSPGELPETGNRAQVLVLVILFALLVVGLLVSRP